MMMGSCSRHAPLANLPKQQQHLNHLTVKSCRLKPDQKSLESSIQDGLVDQLLMSLCYHKVTVSSQFSLCSNFNMKHSDLFHTEQSLAITSLALIFRRRPLKLCLAECNLYLSRFLFQNSCPAEITFAHILSSSVAQPLSVQVLSPRAGAEMLSALHSSPYALLCALSRFLPKPWSRSNPEMPLKD